MYHNPEDGRYCEVGQAKARGPVTDGPLVRHTNIWGMFDHRSFPQVAYSKSHLSPTSGKAQLETWFLSHALPFKECLRSEPPLQVVRFVSTWRLCS